MRLRTYQSFFLLRRRANLKRLHSLQNILTFSFTTAKITSTLIVSIPTRKKEESVASCCSTFGRFGYAAILNLVRLRLHALRSIKGGLPIHRHNDICDLTASLMEEVSTSTETEPALQPLSGEMMHGLSANIQDDSRVDIRCRGFWNPQQDAFFDLRVFNPLASSNQTPALSTVFTRHEREKRRAYDQRIREVEHGSFTPLVFSFSGGMGPSTTIAYKRLAALLAEKRGQRYSLVMTWLRCRLSFSLLRSAITAIRGSRTVRFNRESTQQIELAAAEGHIPSA